MCAFHKLYHGFMPTAYLHREYLHCKGATLPQQTPGLAAQWLALWRLWREDQDRCRQMSGPQLLPAAAHLSTECCQQAHPKASPEHSAMLSVTRSREWGWLLLLPCQARAQLISAVMQRVELQDVLLVRILRCPRCTQRALFRLSRTEKFWMKVGNVTAVPAIKQMLSCVREGRDKIGGC